MPVTGTEAMANVAILGHSHEGKTTLAEALLFAAGASPRLGSTDQGTSVLDYEPEEQRRHISIQTGIAHLTWQQAQITLLDTPGFQDFEGEVQQALAVANSAITVVSATSGALPVGTDSSWARLNQLRLPRLVALTKPDKEHADFGATVAALQAGLDPAPLPLQLPIGEEKEFRGVVDLITGRARWFSDSGPVQDGDCPGELEAEVALRRRALVEAIAETDDFLLERYLEGEEPAEDQLWAALHAAVLGAKLAPLVISAPERGWGASLLLDAISSCLATPRDHSRGLAAPVLFVFKTVADPFGKISYYQVVEGELSGDTHLVDLRCGEAERIARPLRPRGKALDPCDRLGPGEIGAATKLLHVETGDTLARQGTAPLPKIEVPPVFYTMAIRPRTKGDEEKLHAGLTHLVEEDPTLRLERDPSSHQTLLHGLGDVHLEVTLEKLRRKFQVEAVLELPQVPYLEAIRLPVRQQHRYKKQSGGAGLFGDCTIEIEPLARGAGVVFEDRIVGGAIPQPFRVSVEKGVRQALERGVLAGYPIVDLRIRLVDGSTHPVDGKDIAFQLAGAMALREAVEQASPYLLEPVMEVEVVVPSESMGDVISHLNSRRAKIGQMERLEGVMEKVTAQVPLAEMYRFPIELRSTTRGRGRYSMTFGHHQEVAPAAAAPIVQARRELAHWQRDPTAG